MTDSIRDLPTAVAVHGALPVPAGPVRPIADVDVPLPDLEAQIAELRLHAVQHLAERGETPTPEHWVQWHDFLDIDPDLRGRDYTPHAKEAL